MPIFINAIGMKDWSIVLIYFSTLIKVLFFFRYLQTYFFLTIYFVQITKFFQLQVETGS